MGSVLDDVLDAIGSLWDALWDAVGDIWDDIVTPMLEEIFSWFGIVDETVVIVQKTSVMIFGDNTEDVIKAANTKAVMSMVQTGGSFFPWYMKYTRQTYAQVKAFYNYAARERYIHGLPDMEIKGKDVDYTAIDLALDDALGFAATRLSSQALFPSDEIYFKDKFQTTPYFYIPWANTLTYDDPYGITWDDYTLNTIVYNSGPDTFDINISREAEEALFWIEGPVHIVEGDSATYTIKCNRTVPVGKSVEVSLTYGGTAPPADYNEVLTAVITAGNTEVDIVVTTVENAAADGSRTIIVTLATVTNTGAAFEAVGIHTVDSVTTTITDDEGIILTMNSVLVNETDGNAIVAVKLEEATTGAFTADYAMSNGTAFGGGVDFDSTPGVLNFAGTAGEIQNITIPITSDAPDDNEYFTVHFTACSDGTVDYSQVCTVTITDDSDVTPVPGLVILSDVIVEPGYVKDRSLIVTYHADTDPAEEWFYWVYKFSDNTYPDVDPTMSVLTNLEMLPVGILRKDKVSINVDKTTEEYKTTKRLLSMLLLDIDDIIDNIEENPDIDAVDDVFINFAVCPSSDVEIVSKILWLSFYSIVVTHGVTSNTNEYSATFSEQDVQNAVVWTDHTHTADIVGTITNAGEYHHEIIEVSGGSELRIRHQTSAGVYAELVIHNLNGLAAIEHEGYHKMALNRVDDLNFTIPISYFILDELGPLDQLVLYQHILRIDLYSLQLQEIAWYESEIFQDLFTFAAIILTVVTVGAAGGVFAIIQQLVINYLVMELVIYIAELTGNAEFAAIVGFVAMIALGNAAGMPAFDFASAEGLVMASTAFADNLTAGYSMLGEEIREDLIDLNEKAQERLDEINDASPEESPITADFLIALKSVDTTVFPAIKAQYDFDLLYNYDRIIANYHDLHIKTGVI